jgi:serine/threonine protein phosphatase PrpC/CRP-like cAMP-binding protein
VSHNFAEQHTDAFFAVFDGHGRDGDRCANFARDNLPALVEKHINGSKSREEKLLRIREDGNVAVELTKDQIQSACLKAHLQCNRNMHRAKDMDDSLSGTTAISAYLHGRRNRITICNVGDSRAILGTKSDNSPNCALKAMPLSRDQTPYRRDERIRVKKTGARILSLDQIEGLEPIDDDDDGEHGDLELGEQLDEGGDPPRVWSPVGEYPGTAFTRSLGDAIAEELGVFAEPEMLTRELTENDKIIVLASDGVFEFLTNQSVIDMCAKFSDPLEACRAVVAESYELWLQYELRTDDITMICIFVDGVDKKLPHLVMSTSTISARSAVGITAEAVEEPVDDEADTAIPVTAGRPVRMQISKDKSVQLEKMKIKMSCTEDMATEDIDLSKLHIDKTKEEKERIAEAIQASVMFQNITEEEREMIFGVMEPITVKKGTWVIKQGTVGDRFYIVDTGVFEVRIVPEGEEDDGSGGNVVHVYEGSVEKHAHPSFGELALMYSAPRAASIIAQTDGHLWALHRYAFRQVLAQQSTRKELILALKRVEGFRKLKSNDIHNLAASMAEVTFTSGESIVTKDRMGDTMYVILSGSCGK